MKAEGATCDRVTTRISQESGVGTPHYHAKAQFAKAECRGSTDAAVVCCQPRQYRSPGRHRVFESPLAVVPIAVKGNEIPRAKKRQLPSSSVSGSPSDP